MKNTISSRLIFLSVLLGFASALNYLDRQSFGILTPILEKEFHWTNSQYSWLVNAFTISYGFGMLLGGCILDRFSLRTTYTAAILLWSLAIMLHGFVGGWLGFLIVRLLLGFAEAGNHPCAVRAAGLFIPATQRSIPVSWINSGVNIGAMIAPCILLFLSELWGWRTSFIIIGVLGLCWIPFWLYFCNHFPTLESNSVATNKKETDFSVIKSKPFLGFFIYRFCGDPCWYFLVFWLPKYFHETHHIDLKDFSHNLFYIYFLATLGNIGVGWLTQKIAKNDKNLVRQQSVLMGICASGSLALLLIPFSPYLLLSTLFIGILAAGHQGSMSLYFNQIADIFGKENSAKITAWTTIGGVVSGVIFARIVGYALDQGVTYHTLFMFIPLLYLIGFGSFWILTSKARKNV